MRSLWCALSFIKNVSSIHWLWVCDYGHFTPGVAANIWKLFAIFLRRFREVGRQNQRIGRECLLMRCTARDAPCKQTHPKWGTRAAKVFILWVPPLKHTNIACKRHWRYHKHSKHLIIIYIMYQMNLLYHVAFLACLMPFGNRWV